MTSKEGAGLVGVVVVVVGVVYGTMNGGDVCRVGVGGVGGRWRGLLVVHGSINRGWFFFEGIGVCDISALGGASFGGG